MVGPYRERSPTLAGSPGPAIVAWEGKCSGGATRRDAVAMFRPAP